MRQHRHGLHASEMLTPNSRLPRFVRLAHGACSLGCSVCAKGAPGVGAGGLHPAREFLYERRRWAGPSTRKRAERTLAAVVRCRCNSEREIAPPFSQRPMHPVRVCAAFCLDFIEFLVGSGLLACVTAPWRTRHAAAPGQNPPRCEYHDLTQQYMRKIPPSLPMSSFEFLFLRMVFAFHLRKHQWTWHSYWVSVYVVESLNYALFYTLSVNTRDWHQVKYITQNLITCDVQSLISNWIETACEPNNSN